MKTQETVLLCCLCAALAGVVSSLATRAALETRRAPVDSLENMPATQEVPVETAGGTRDWTELAMENSSLSDRLDALEARLSEVLSTRTPVQAATDTSVDRTPLDPDAIAKMSALLEEGGGEVTPAFVASVDQALEQIRAQEEVERDRRRKEQDAKRIEERLTRMQTELGLTGRQVADLRTVFLKQDEKRNTLFEEMRDGEGDRRVMFENMRALRDETLESMATVLTAEQLASYRESEEFRRPGGPGEFDGPGPYPFTGGRRGR